MTTLGKYKLLQQLGTGSMGTVYAAHDTILDRSVALKAIRTGSKVDPEIKERFHREARTCARLQHPSIVTVFDLGEQDDFAYIAMELLTGADFRRVISTRSRMDAARKVEAMIQVCEALAHPHREGIVHRDIKPSNLFLQHDNRAKILDFGIARLPSSRLTVAGRILGTPNYMAPEQISGKPTDGRSDLFSAAVVFFEFLTNEHPFKCELIPRRILNGEPDSVFDHDSSVPLPFERIFARGMARDPLDRYATGDEFAADLNTVLDGMRQDSSPHFSRFVLPSQRAPAAEEPESAPILNAADEQGTEERRLSDFLEVLPLFEKALDDGDHAGAEWVLKRLQSVAGESSRFAESLRICRDRFVQMPSPVLLSASESAAATLPENTTSDALAGGFEAPGDLTLLLQNPGSESAPKTRAIAAGRNSVEILLTELSGYPSKQTQWRAFMQRTGIEMPGAFPDVVIAIRQFLASPMRAITIEREATLYWQAGGPWRAHDADVG